MIRVALHHKTSYRYSRPVELGPQVVRLRPAPHCRTTICSYSLKSTPAEQYLNWQQDPHSNYLARLVFSEPTQLFEVEVDLVAEMTVINPFDFFLEPAAEKFPFGYDQSLAKDLKPFLHTIEAGPKLSALLDSIDRSSIKTIDFLVDLNQRLQREIFYEIRMEPGVQTPEETLTLASGSCRDSAWLMAQVLRHLGLASRFVSGYLIQLKPDVESLDGPSGAKEDFTDLHAWTEVFLPGAGWVGLDPTSGLFAGEGHIPLACTPDPSSAAPITGTVGQADVEFDHEMVVTRVHEDPRVTKPYTDEQWRKIEAVGHRVDSRMEQSSVRLTMGGEPTFVSIDDMDGDEWKTAAVGPTKRSLAGNLLDRLRKRFARGGVIHYGQGKWYPGESLPRWALTCMWRTDGQTLWTDPQLLADPATDYGHTVDDAQKFSELLATKLGVNPKHVVKAYEDALYYMWKEQRLPANANVFESKLEDEEERTRIARVFERGLKAPVGCVLPVIRHAWQSPARWTSGLWKLRPEHMFLIPGDSPLGLRLPLDSLPPLPSSELPSTTVIPFEEVEDLPEYESLRKQFALRSSESWEGVRNRQQVLERVAHGSDIGFNAGGTGPNDPEHGNGHYSGTEGEAHHSNGEHHVSSDGEVVRTAMCFEPRDGILHVFMPPVDRLEDYLELLTAIEQTADELDTPIVIEGYLPPEDYRLQHIKVTPDPGVIEVNVHPARNWKDLVDITSGIYEDARLSRLGTEKFDTDGAHTGTGGGNHIVMGGSTPADSPFLRRPDLLRSLVGYWHNHPSLSYLFSGKFIGPTSQAPRVDEGRCDSTYELQIAFDQIPTSADCPPWVVDRVFRDLLVDLTGNTHRSEFCIDKLFSPDSATGRLGLVEFRAFEMPPHWQMSLTQQLLLRALVTRFWDEPYNEKLANWKSSIHDRWLLPHFVEQDFADVIEETNMAGVPLEMEWFAPHFEFRYPVIGELDKNGVHLELRTAIEPWYVLGEEPAGGHTARYVDSSLERMQLKVRGMVNERHMITCNGRKVPLHPTGTQGEFVAGVRYRAWQPPSCLHPTIPVDEPLVFDLLDTWMGRSLGGCKYHVGHPGGMNSDNFPVNAYEAESRRGSRFFKMGHTGGKIEVPNDEPNAVFPMTLDLRRNRPAV